MSDVHGAEAPPVAHPQQPSLLGREMLHGVSNPQPHLAGLGGSQGIRNRRRSRREAVLVRGKAASVAPLISDRGEADSLAQSLRPPEDCLRFTTLLPLLVEPDTACLHEFVGARPIPREARDDRSDERLQAQQHILPRFACFRLVVVAVIVTHDPLLSAESRVASVNRTSKVANGRSGKAEQFCHHFRSEKFTTLRADSPGTREELPCG